MKTIRKYINEKLFLTQNTKAYITFDELKNLPSASCILIRKKYKPTYFRGAVNMYQGNNKTEMHIAGPYKKLSGGINICLMGDYIENESYDSSTIIAATNVYHGVILTAANKEYFDLLSQDTLNELLELGEKEKDRKGFAIKAKKIIEDNLK